MAEIKFGNYNPAWQRAYRVTQTAMCAVCAAVLVLMLVLWSIRPVPAVFLAAGISNGMEAADRFRKKRGNKRKIGQTLLFAVLAAVSLCLAAAAIYLLW